MAAEITDEELTKIYNNANGILAGKAPPITTAKIFAAMREAMFRQRIADCHVCLSERAWASVPRILGIKV